jgi:hypothetical protein
MERSGDKTSFDRPGLRYWRVPVTWNRLPRSIQLMLTTFPRSLVRTRAIRALGSLFLPILISSCDLLEPGSGQDRARLEHSWRTWQMSGSGNYYYVQRRLCNCPSEVVTPVGISVREGIVTERLRLYDNVSVPLQYSQLWGTVDDLFRIIEHALDSDAASLVVYYDRYFGYPTHIAIDYRADVADDEITITSSALVLIGS